LRAAVIHPAPAQSVDDESNQEITVTDRHLYRATLLAAGLFIAVHAASSDAALVNDSNHRYATSDAIYNQMVAEGWSGEGTVYCAPQ
jgi:hypothetical protein